MARSKCEGNFVRPLLVGVPAAADHVRRPVLHNLMLKVTSLHQRLTTCGGRVGAWVLSSTQGVIFCPPIVSSAVGAALAGDAGVRSSLHPLCLWLPSSHVKKLEDTLLPSAAKSSTNRLTQGIQLSALIGSQYYLIFPTTRASTLLVFFCH